MDYYPMSTLIYKMNQSSDFFMKINDLTYI